MPEPSAKPLVLIADDTPILRTVVRLMLEQLGYRVLAVGSGAEAVAAVAAQPVDLVLMDCRMPGLDGYEATALIRRDLAPGRRLPIIALSGDDLPADRARCRAAGMDDHLAKPVTIETLGAALTRWLRQEPASAPPATPRLDEGSTLPILDPAPLAHFDRLRAGSSAKLLEVYAADLAASGAALTRAVEAQDLPAVVHLAHKLKGSSLTIGAKALGAGFRRLQEVAASASLPVVSGAWGDVQVMLEQTRLAIASRLRPISTDERVSHVQLLAQRNLVQRSPGLVTCLEAMPGPALLLNRSRQIVLANRRFNGMSSLHGVETLLGQRPGEAIGCHHAADSPDGCGTSEACSFCGALRSILSALSGQGQGVNEARLTVGADTGHAVELEIVATPLELEGQMFVLLAMRDISDLKQRQLLERLFFHDVRNSIGGIHGLVTQLAQGRLEAGEVDRAVKLLERSTRQLSDEVVYQQMLVRAESGELRVELRVEDPAVLLRQVLDTAVWHPVAGERTLVLGELLSAPVLSDRTLFSRVLGNLVLNALEATPPGGTVTVGCRPADGAIACWVRNPGVMPVDIQRQVFQRSFTTKGTGRGLGTWSAKLLGERYLGGRISFTSNAAQGTEMRFEVPLAP